jgi:hypothetical protein
MSDANAHSRKRASVKCGSEQVNGGDSAAELIAAQATNDEEN